MLGAIIGDIVGSRFEWDNYRAKDFDLFHEKCFATDDSIMTIAIGRAVLDHKATGGSLQKAAKRRMREIGRPYPGCGFGGRFFQWIYSDTMGPYHSFGNGAAMRISAVGWAAESLEEVYDMSYAATKVTHDHPEGLKGAEATAVAIYLARTGHSQAEIRAAIEKTYYKLDFTIDQIRPTYRFNETCQETVPQAIEAFLEAESFEDCIRIAISVGGDSDTLAAITGSIAEAYFGIPEAIAAQAVEYLDPFLREHYDAFVAAYPGRILK